MFFGRDWWVDSHERDASWERIQPVDHDRKSQSKDTRTLMSEPQE